MPTDPKRLSERAKQVFSQSGGSWRDYALLADSDPPCIMRGSRDGIAMLHIDDPELAQACRQFLVEHNARTFRSFEELARAFGAPIEVRVREEGNDKV